MGLLAADAIDRPPVGDRHRPRPHRPAAAVEARRLPPDLDEDLLGDLLGVLTVVQDALADTEHDRRELVVERGEGRLVASCDLEHQVCGVVLESHRVRVAAPLKVEHRQHATGSSPTVTRIGLTLRERPIVRGHDDGHERHEATLDDGAALTSGPLLATLVLPSAPTSPLGGCSTESMM